MAWRAARSCHFSLVARANLKRGKQSRRQAAQCAARRRLASRREARREPLGALRRDNHALLAHLGDLVA